MEKIRISKVEDVTLWRRGVRFEGTLHLASHHMIFSYIPPPAPDQLQATTPTKPRELWITYPMVSFCTYRPSPPASHLQPSIRIRCRDFTFVAFHFTAEAKAKQVFDTIRNLSCRLGRIEKLYAFTYQAQGPEKDVNGWKIYDPVKEFSRLGVGSKGTSRGWRITKINEDYTYSPTYPATLAVPASISDNVLNYASRYRSRARLPVLTYIHPVNDCSITRSSQPLVGVRGNRSVQDERLVAAIFATSKAELASPESAATPEDARSQATSGTSTPKNSSPETSTKSLETLEDEAIAKMAKGSNFGDGNEDDKGPRLYGAQQHNLIVDARPTVNAYAMQAIGMGSENMDHYPFATKAYLGIDNIHVMRDSLNKVVEALKDSDVTPLAPAKEQLAKSGWLKHIANMLDGVGLIARQIGIHHSHVLIHCSDGWDRTSQLSSLSQLCLDPYYRTIEGFIVLIEKDWLSFGHMFRHRTGFLSSEKWFEVEHERIGGTRTSTGETGSSRSGNNALENALLSAKGFFNKHSNDSREYLGDAEGELHQYDSSPSAKSSGKAGSEDKTETKVKETSPVFHQFLDAVYQLQYQHPTRFEFNERFLRRLLYQLYACQYGTFLYDNERQRVEAKVQERTRSVWDYFLARKEQFLNDKYDETIDDNVRGKERLLFPDHKKTRWWAEVFGRTDDEMNSVAHPLAPELPNGHVPSALTGIETAESSMGPGVIEKPKENGSAPVSSDSASFASKFARFTVGDNDGGMENQKESRRIQQQLEMEMQ